MAKKKKIPLSGDNYNIDTLGFTKYQQTKNMIHNKYFNIFMSKVKWTGINNWKAEWWLMKEFWAKGTAAAIKLKHTEDVAFAQYNEQRLDALYDMPETVTLTNARKSPLLPVGELVIDKDVVIGFIQANHHPIVETVNYYADKIAEVEACIWINLQVHKLPFLINTDDQETSETQMKKIVTDIINNRLVIFGSKTNTDALKVVATAAPYLIDKLQEYKICLENELKTYIGVDNQGGVEKREQMQLDEINANNEEINSCNDSIINALEDFCDRINKVLGLNISVECAQERVTSIGEVHDGAKPGPKEGESDEE